MLSASGLSRPFQSTNPDGLDNPAPANIAALPSRIVLVYSRINSSFVTAITTSCVIYYVLLQLFQSNFQDCYNHLARYSHIVHHIRYQSMQETHLNNIL